MVVGPPTITTALGRVLQLAHRGGAAPVASRPRPLAHLDTPGPKLDRMALRPSPGRPLGGVGSGGAQQGAGGAGLAQRHLGHRRGEQAAPGGGCPGQRGPHLPHRPGWTAYYTGEFYTSTITPFINF